jgi:uncharacterized protein
MTDRPIDRRDWMLTFTGRAFYPLAPLVEDVDPVDIAHHLSLLCRYGGAVRRFYSVAEHCVLMSHAVAPENALAALLHDATEAYVQDLIKPLKRSLPEYCAIEDKLAGVIAERFDISATMPAEVKQADLRILLDERAALLADSPRSWGSVEGLEPLGVDIHGWGPADAERHYRLRLAELMEGR